VGTDRRREKKEAGEERGNKNSNDGGFCRLLTPSHTHGMGNDVSTYHIESQSAKEDTKHNDPLREPYPTRDTIIGCCLIFSSGILGDSSPFPWRTPWLKKYIDRGFTTRTQEPVSFSAISSPLSIPNFDPSLTSHAGIRTKKHIHTYYRCVFFNPSVL